MFEFKIEESTTMVMTFICAYDSDEMIIKNNDDIELIEMALSNCKSSKKQPWIKLEEHVSEEPRQDSFEPYTATLVMAIS